MSYLHDDLDEEAPSATAYNTPHRELTLGTGTILGIFFGLALLCALFFGFGYSMGSRAHQSPVVATDSNSPEGANFSAFSKPNPGAPAGSPSPAPSASTSVPLSAPSSAAPRTPVEPKPEAESAPIVRVPTPPAAPVATPKAAEAPAPRSAPASEIGLTFVVQIAAVSHQEDADLLVNALKRKGYNVVARTEPQDRLFHIQIGPFGTKKDADAMRLRLQGDGYNAMVK